MRKTDWQQQLLTTIEAAMKRPFCWGKTDCCLFVADCCFAISGKDPAEKYRGQYDSELGAKKALLKFGSIESALSSLFTEIPVGMAQRGDVVLFDGDNGKTVGVLWAGKIWSTGENGVVPVSAKPITAWRVE